MFEIDPLSFFLVYTLITLFVFYIKIEKYRTLETILALSKNPRKRAEVIEERNKVKNQKFMYVFWPLILVREIISVFKAQK